MRGYVSPKTLSETPVEISEALSHLVAKIDDLNLGERSFFRAEYNPFGNSGKIEVLSRNIKELLENPSLISVHALKIIERCAKLQRTVRREGVEYDALIKAIDDVLRKLKLWLASQQSQTQSQSQQKSQIDLGQSKTMAFELTVQLKEQQAENMRLRKMIRALADENESLKQEVIRLSRFQRQAKDPQEAFVQNFMRGSQGLTMLGGAMMNSLPESAGVGDLSVESSGSIKKALWLREDVVEDDESLKELSGRVEELMTPDSVDNLGPSVSSAAGHSKAESAMLSAILPAASSVAQVECMDGEGEESIDFEDEGLSKKKAGGSTSAPFLGAKENVAHNKGGGYEGVTNPMLTN